MAQVRAAAEVGPGTHAVHEAENSIAFGRFRLDCRRRALLADGEPVTLHARALDVLEFLIAQRDRIVTQKEIIAHVWRGLAVGENNLRVQMSALRKALADHGGEGLIINQVGRGYRFVGDVVEAAGSAADTVCAPAPSGEVAPAAVHASVAMADAPDVPKVQRRWSFVWVGTLVLTVVVLAAGAAWRVWSPSRLAPRLSIAVLPFADHSSDRSQDWMAEAITDDLTTDLSHIPGSIVIARESADSFRGRAVPTAEIGRALNVRYLLEGSLLAEDGRYRIGARLIEAGSGVDLWAERFDVKADRLADAQTAIVRRIATALDARLTELESFKSAHERPDNPDAESLFFQARAIRETDDSLQAFNQAQDLLERAVKLQPDYGDAMAALGLTLALKVRGTDDPAWERDWPEAKQRVAQALLLAPHNAVALAASARLEETDGHCATASDLANEALAEEPNSMDALAVLAKCALTEGRFDDAARYEDLALQLNPESHMNTSRYGLLALVRLLQGRYRDAIDMSYRSLANEPVPAPGAPTMGRSEYSRLVLMAALELNGEHDKAHAVYVMYDAVWPHRSVWRVAEYSSRAWGQSEGHLNFKRGLKDAGMPEYANEYEDDHVPPFSVPHLGSAFDPTPTTISPAHVIDTAQLQSLLRHNQPAVINLGRGAVVIDASFWIGSAPNNNDFIDDVLRQHVGNIWNAPIVVMASGSSGLDSYNGALHVCSAGYRDVFWYRGGEEAWAKANLPSKDMRMQ